MRENRPYGLEGGEPVYPASLPLSMSSYVLTAAAEYTQFARNDRYLLVPFESVVALEQSMHNKHAFAQIHPKVGWVDPKEEPSCIPKTRRIPTWPQKIDLFFCSQYRTPLPIVFKRAAVDSLLIEFVAIQ